MAYFQQQQPQEKNGAVQAVPGKGGQQQGMGGVKPAGSTTLVGSFEEPYEFYWSDNEAVIGSGGHDGAVGGKREENGEDVDQLNSLIKHLCSDSQDEAVVEKRNGEPKVEAAEVQSTEKGRSGSFKAKRPETLR